MSFGLQLLNTSGDVIIDDTSYLIEGSTLRTSTSTYATYPIDNEFLGIGIMGYSLKHCDFYVMPLTATTVRVQLIKKGNYPVADLVVFKEVQERNSTEYGLQIFDANGKLTASSSTYPFEVLEVVTGEVMTASNLLANDGMHYSKGIINDNDVYMLNTVGLSLFKGMLNLPGTLNIWGYYGLGLKSVSNRVTYGYEGGTSESLNPPFPGNNYVPPSPTFLRLKGKAS